MKTQRRHELTIRCFGAALALCSLLLAGCAPTDEGKTVGDANKEHSEMERIKNDPNMPPQAKAAAIKGMQDGKAAAQQAQRMKQP